MQMDQAMLVVVLIASSIACCSIWCGIRLKYYAETYAALYWIDGRQTGITFDDSRQADDQPLDPVKEPALTQDTLRAIAAAGTTTLSARFIHHSLEHYLKQIHALAQLHANI